MNSGNGGDDNGSNGDGSTAMGNGCDSGMMVGLVGDGEVRKRGLVQLGENSMFVESTSHPATSLYTSLAPTSELQPNLVIHRPTPLPFPPPFHPFSPSLTYILLRLSIQTMTHLTYDII